MPDSRHPLSLLLAATVATLAACGKAEAPKPPELVTNVTAATVANRDIPMTESAVGAETGLGAALDYDPTRVGRDSFHVRLPFPEHVANRLRVGQPVSLSTFNAPDKPVAGRIREIRPPLNATTHTRDVIVSVAQGGWRPLGSIRGEVTLGVRQRALVVPEQAVVLRPGGTVVYVIEGDRATERVVRTGIARGGVIEVVEGVKAGETVVVDGAALLTDKARIKVREAGGAS
jgi:multidrug efflux pump subunit AcrA (membrane-fusion protein)